MFRVQFPCLPYFPQLERHRVYSIMEKYQLLCYVDGMLVGSIWSTVIPRIGETIYVDNLDNSLLSRQTWDVLHVNYSFQIVDDSPSDLNQISLTLIESKIVTGAGYLMRS